ncbi:MAG TPA: hypothetical protein VGW40_06810 [Allosphingosinicella sp.]|nr:hypothetical protein [Allosphingosinicella sp.]
MTKADLDRTFASHRADTEGSANLRQEAERFLVFYTREYGYSLSPEADLNVTIIPEFLDDSVLGQFERAFSVDNLRMNVGKRIFCDCVIERRSRDDVPSFLIREARLFYQ